MAEQSGAPWPPLKRRRGRSSSCAAARKDYDVFLNHRGPDVKGSFVAHLEEALRAAGLNPFLDKSSLEKGEPAFGCIDAALEMAKVHVAVVSSGYAESKFCLIEVAAMVASGKPVIPVLYDVEPAALRRVEQGAFAAAFEKHKSRESAEQVREWAAALSQLADITAVCFRLSDYKGDEVQLKWEVVDAVMDRLPANEESLQVDQHLVGLDDHVNTCVNELDKMHGSTFMLCVTGMGGVGKTTLAKAIYNHLIGLEKFGAGSYLEIDRMSPSSMEVGPSLVTRLQKQLLWDVLGVPDGSQERYSFWFNKLSSRGPVLIVLDDIQDKAQFDKLIPKTSLFAPGSCIIITSRDRDLLKLVCQRSESYFHEVSPLGWGDSMELFNWHAFGDKEALPGFEGVASDVNKACGGLPLALKVVGLSLFDKTSDGDLQRIWPEAINALKRDRVVTSALRWSYDCLLEPEKLMFVDIACVFHGWKVDKAMQVWKGCIECSSCCGAEAPHIYLKSLIDKSLILIDGANDSLAMHGLVRDMGQNIGLVDGSHLWKGDKAVKMMEAGSQVLDKVRALNLTKQRKCTFEVDKCPKMPNLHYLTLDGCEVSGDLGSISEELRFLQWRGMPLRHPPPISNLFNLVSLDFSYSTNLASIWAESSPSLESCPNLLKLDLTFCTSVTGLPESLGRLSRLQVLELHGCENLRELPESIGRLSRLQILHLVRCWNLRKLPDSVGHLTALKNLHITACRSLEALPESLCALSGLQSLRMGECESIWKLPTTLGLPTGVTAFHTDLVSEAHAVGIGQLNSLKDLIVWEGSEEGITALDRSGALGNLTQLSSVHFCGCTSITKLPRTLGLLANLDFLDIFGCEELHELPNSVGQLRHLNVNSCSSLKSLPDSLGASTSLEFLDIAKCTALTELPASMGHSSSLRWLFIDGCGELQALPASLGHLSSLCCLFIQGCCKLQALPHSLRQLKLLVRLSILECGSLEGLGLLRVLQGLRIWGCTSITELPGSCLDVVDSKFEDPASFYDRGELLCFRREVRELRVVEANDCGFVRQVQDDSPSARLILQRVHKLPCYNCEKGKVVGELVGLPGPL